jgi:hypothetical protein
MAEMGRRGEQDAVTADPPDTSASLVVYLHIPRTVEVSRLFVRGYSKAAVQGVGDVFRRPERAATRIRKLAEMGEDVRVVTGVTPYGLLRAHLPADSRYVTFLREPVARTISHYHWLVGPRGEGSPDSSTPEEQPPSLPPALETSLEQMLESGEHLLDNLATRLLCGRESPFGTLPEDALETAKENLREGFEFVGISERLDQSIVLLQRMLGIDVPFRGRIADGDGPGVEDLPAAERLLLEQHNRFDLELYSLARELFEEKLAASGGSFSGTRGLGRGRGFLGRLGRGRGFLGRLGLGQGDRLEPAGKRGDGQRRKKKSSGIARGPFPPVPKGEADAAIEIVEPGPVESEDGTPRREAKIHLAGARVRGGIRVFVDAHEDPGELRELVSQLDVRFGTPPLYRFENLVFQPRSDCLYDENGQRVVETCRPRYPHLQQIRSGSPEAISVPRDAPVMDRPVLYCGLFAGHWGLFLTESISRLWPLFEGDVPADVALIGPRLISGELKRTNAFVARFLHHAGIPLERFFHFPAVTRLSEVFVPHPSFAIRGQAFDAHFSVTERVGASICGPTGASSDQPVYLSRSRLSTHKQRYSGEEALDDVLRRRGVEVVAPELLSFEDQVRLFNRHSTFIGCIGSAFHSLMFARPEQALRTVVIDRAISPHFANFFMIDLLKQIDANYVCIEALDRSGERAFGTLDIAAVESFLEDLSVI